jgi:hypothetical protein
MINRIMLIRVQAKFHPWPIYVLILLAGIAWFPCGLIGAEPAEDALRATVRLFDGGTSGTGFFVATGDAADAGKRNLLVTAAHVFESMKGDKCTAVFRLIDRDRGFGRKQSNLVIRNGQAPLWVRHPDFDIAVLPVDLPEGVDVKAYDDRQIADGKFAEEGRIGVGHDVYVPCFPTQLEANPAGWPILRRGAIASHPLTPLSSAKTMLVDYTNFNGDSGAPVVVWFEKEPIVVGIVSAMHRQSDKTTTPFEERTVHTSMGLGIAVQSPFIRQTIEAWRKQSNP